MTAASSSVTSPTETPIQVTDTQETKPKPVRRDNCMGHHWKMLAITFTPGFVGLGFGIGSIIAGALVCRNSSNYAAAIACAVVAMALGCFGCIQLCLPYAKLPDDQDDKKDPKAYCNGVVCKASGTFALKAFGAGLVGGILLGVNKSGC